MSHGLHFAPPVLVTQYTPATRPQVTTGLLSVREFGQVAACSVWRVRRLKMGQTESVFKWSIHHWLFAKLDSKSGLKHSVGRERIFKMKEQEDCVTVCKAGRMVLMSLSPSLALSLFLPPPPAKLGERESLGIQFVIVCKAGSSRIFKHSICHLFRTMIHLCFYLLARSYLDTYSFLITY